MIVDDDDDARRWWTREKNSPVELASATITMTVHYWSLHGKDRVEKRIESYIDYWWHELDRTIVKPYKE